MKKILITGANGCIGTCLWQTLVREGHDVICLDRTPVKDLHFVRHDITQPLPKIKVDEIYNLAGTPSPAQYLLNPVHTMKTNVIGTINVLDLAVYSGAKVLQASTCEVYAQDDLLSTRACYRQGKKMAESIFNDYKREYDVDIRIARIFNTYGPTMNLYDGRVIPEFIRRTLFGEDITILGDGSIKRSFCYVEDMVRALMSVMDTTITEPVDLFHPEELTIKEIAECIIKEVGSQSQIVYREGRENDFAQNISKAKKLNWTPRITFQEGIKKTINYFRGQSYVGKEN
jgi:UDP-glucuronate decarboxylase